MMYEYDKASQKSKNGISFSRFNIEDKIVAMDPYKGWLYMASKYGGRKEYKTDQRLDEQKKKWQGPPIGYIFDR